METVAEAMQAIEQAIKDLDSEIELGGKLPTDVENLREAYKTLVRYFE